jgi:predicted esterase
MSWMSFPRRPGRYRTVKGPPEALVVLLPDLGSPAATLASVAARWSASVPTASFLALDGLGQLGAGSDSAASASTGPGAMPARLDRASHDLETLLASQLHSHCLNSYGLVLVGFGYGGTLALHLLLHRGFGCTGVLAIAAQFESSLPRVRTTDSKVRLVECSAGARIDHARLRDRVALLMSRGLDARGVLVAASPLSVNTIRHGGAYLVELVASAQRGGRLHVAGGSSHA